MEKHAISAEPRNSSFELLRIIAMLMIVSYHFSVYGGFLPGVGTPTVARAWRLVLELMGDVGVDVFVLISGYFLIANSSRTLSIPRVIRFWGQLFFYSVGIYSVLAFAGKSDFSGLSIAKALFPISTSSWWFASTYFVLYLLHPFLNDGLKSLSKKRYQGLLVILSFMWCIGPSFSQLTFQSNNLLWFMTLYAIAGYIRLFGVYVALSFRKSLLLFVAVMALRCLTMGMSIWLGMVCHPLASRGVFLCRGRQSILTVFAALLLFLSFSKLRLRFSKWINYLASASFGVYLIHDHALVCRFLWHDVFCNAQYQDQTVIVPYSIAVVLLVYIGCTGVDLLRKHFVESFGMRLVYRYSNQWENRIRHMSETIAKALFGE